MDPSSDHFCMLVRIEPGATGPSHWHLSDTIYIPRRGELHIPGEGVYREGRHPMGQGRLRLRWGASPAPTGLSSIFISLGPYGSFDASHVDPPPLGRWDQPTEP